MPRKIKLCMAVNNLDVGGLEKVVISLLQSLPRDRFDLHLICLSGPGKLFDEVDLPADSRLVLAKKALFEGVRDRLDAPRIMLEIGNFLRRAQVDILHTHNLAPLVFSGLPARFAGHPRPLVVYSEHNQIYRAGPSARRRFRLYARLADEVVAVSHDLERTLVRDVKVPRRVRVIHNGIDGGRFTGAGAAEVRRELGLEPDTFVIGTAVVLSEQKGIPYLLEAAKIVLAEEPKVRFVIAGDGPKRAELEAAARDLQLGERVRFLGYRRDVPQLLAAYDVYVLSSLWEGLPLALLEALALGKPIVATAVGGNPEVVTDGENGCLVPPRDPRALAAALLRVVRERPFREAVRGANTQKFATRFSLGSMVDAHVRFYEGLTAGRA